MTESSNICGNGQTGHVLTGLVTSYYLTASIYMAVFCDIGVNNVKLRDYEHEKFYTNEVSITLLLLLLTCNYNQNHHHNTMVMYKLTLIIV